MLPSLRRVKSVTIFADESANWKIAGLRQIERLIFGLEELALQDGELAPDTVEIVWDEKLAESARRLPERNYAPLLKVREATNENNSLRLTTRWLVRRGKMGEALANNNSNGCCRILASSAELPAAEKWFVHSLGKPQDGWVARHIDRRISTRISRWLIRGGAQPLHATIAALLFALAGCAFLLRGDYTSILLGTVLLYGFSIFDGCDGEIARACYRDSAIGRRIDLIADTVVNILFVACLGFGLGLVREGIVTALLIIATEALLFLIPRSTSAQQPIPSSRYYDRYARMLARSGALKFSGRLVDILAQVTKRDVAWVGFIVLAALGAPALILHASLVVGVLAASLSAIALIRRPKSAR